MVSIKRKKTIAHPCRCDSKGMGESFLEKGFMHLFPYFYKKLLVVESLDLLFHEVEVIAELLYLAVEVVDEGVALLA